MNRMWRGAPALLLALASLEVAPPAAHAADRKPPKIVTAATGDADNDGHLDGVLVTYNETVRHKRDADGRYPFTVAGYTVSNVGAGKGKTVRVGLVEGGAPDLNAAPVLTYKPTRSKPVIDLAGNQSKGVTVPTIVLDADDDGYSPAQGDCAPLDLAVHPGAPDVPDVAFVDKNCDGIDGEIALATFVATTGSGTACTMASPCGTVQQGIDTASTGGLRDVYVAGGTYPNGTFAMANGVSVYGGFGQNFQRDPLTATGAREGIVQGQSAVSKGGLSNQALTVVAVNLAAPATLADLTLVGAAAGAGKSSYTVFVSSVGGLTIARNHISAGAGGDGSAGIDGVDATTTAAPAAATDGGDADEFVISCDSSSKGAGGPAAANSAPSSPSSRNMNGGQGGSGGTMDTDCGFPNFDFDAKPGLAGSPALFDGTGTASDGGAGGLVCAAGLPGHSGPVANGSPGSGAASGGQIVASLWTAKDGSSGGTGENGGGGGGGGGSGGCDSGTDSYGAGGGGGGAGGSAAHSGGGGGHGAGGSFDIYVANPSFVTVTGNTITRGAGGDGGSGGAGGQGQTGGAGGSGGAAAGDSPAGGDGGEGGHGGHGGGGGGGAGGRSVGILWTPTSTVSQSGNTFLAGSGGLGGAGGVSAPLAPLAIADGNAGGSGAAGTTSDTFVCATLAAC